MSNNQNQGASIEAEHANPTPWRITDPDERKGREIVDAKGGTVAKLTVLDMANAELIVASVNARRTSAAQVGVGELPPLPEPLCNLCIDDYGNWVQAYSAGEAVYTAEQVEEIRRAAIEADRAQLAQQGQCEISAIVKNVAKQMMDELTEQFGQPDEDGEEEAARNYLTGKFAAISLMERRILALAAPASAQPADPIKDHVLREVVNSLRDTALVYHAHGSLRERLRQCLDPLLTSGAQPDQRESANNGADEQKGGA